MVLINLQVDELRERTQSIQLKIVSVKQLHEALLASPFETQGKNLMKFLRKHSNFLVSICLFCFAEKMDSKAALMTEIEKESGAVRSYLREMELCLNAASPPDLFARIVRTQYNAELLRFQTVMEDYNSALVDFSRRSLSRLKTQFNDGNFLYFLVFSIWYFYSLYILMISTLNFARSGSSGHPKKFLI